MNKFTYALALGAGLVLSLAAPNAQADPIVQTLTHGATCRRRNSTVCSRRRPAVLTENYAFMNTARRASWSRRSSPGHGACAGPVCLRLPVRRQQRDGHDDQQPTSVNSASMLFNATPVVTNFTRLERLRVRRDRRTGRAASTSRGLPPASCIQTPSSIAWQPGTSTGSLTFQYLNPTTSAGPLAAGATSGTIVVISTQPFSQQNVS